MIQRFIMKSVAWLMPLVSLGHPAFASDKPEGLVAPADPPAGLARVHVFRPDFSAMGQYDSPVLFLNNREVGKIDHRSYIEVLVSPGKLQYELKPSVFASASWAISGTMDVREGQKYYLAIWTAGEGGSYNGMGFVPALGPLPIMPVPTTTAVHMKVLTEVVDEGAALEALQGLPRMGPVVVLK